MSWKSESPSNRWKSTRCIRGDTHHNVSACGQQLLWLPIEEATAEAANAALTMLFTIHGPPLVLKCDNGTPFLATSTCDLLRTWKVLALFSPPGLPSYNGSCEAGIGSMKTRTHHHATRHGRQGQWTSDDVEAARLEANTTARPWGPRGPTPEDAWNQRPRVTTTEQEAFQKTVEEVNGRAPETASADHYRQAAIDREAISRALVAHGFLFFRGRRIPLPIPRPKVAKIR